MYKHHRKHAIVSCKKLHLVSLPTTIWPPFTTKKTLTNIGNMFPQTHASLSLSICQLQLVQTKKCSDISANENINANINTNTYTNKKNTNTNTNNTSFNICICRLTLPWLQWAQVEENCIYCFHWAKFNILVLSNKVIYY